MVKWLLILAILVAGTFFGYRRFISEEGRVRQTLSVVEKCFHKEKPESESEAKARVHELAERLEPGCRIEIPEGKSVTVLDEKTLEPMLAVFSKVALALALMVRALASTVFLKVVEKLSVPLPTTMFSVPAVQVTAAFTSVAWFSKAMLAVLPPLASSKLPVQSFTLPVKR